MSTGDGPAPRDGLRAAGPLFCTLFVLLSVATAGKSAAHWIAPEDIVASLQHDVGLQQNFGLRSVRRDGRILIVLVDEKIWNRAARTERIKLADSWHQLWRHNVPQGIVAVLSEEGERPLVNYNARGEARLIDGE